MTPTEAINTAERLAASGFGTAFFALLIFAILCVVWLARYFVAQLEKRDAINAANAVELKTLIRENTAATTAQTVCTNANSDVMRAVTRHLERIEGRSLTTQ